jgi:CRISPR/Cas system-associated endonuclease/helicase Cas3
MVSSDQHNVGYSQGLFDLNYEIVCKNGFYLADNITDAYYKKWFSSKCINVLNKSQCGNGGTTGFIRYALAENKGLLVLVPNISICKSKEKEYKDDERVCCIYGGKNGIRLDAKVIIATYDQMHKMLTSMSDCGVDYNEDWTSKIWSDRLIVLDEYHKLISECGYRNICYSITNMLKYTNYGVMLMSATPNLLYIKMLKKYSGKEVVSYTIKYNDDKVNLMYKVEQKHILIYNVEKKMQTSSIEHI